ncbi:ATP-binding cassette sub- G member 2, partial [Cladochytrium tenue]
MPGSEARGDGGNGDAASVGHGSSNSSSSGSASSPTEVNYAGGGGGGAVQPAVPNAAAAAAAAAAEGPRGEVGGGSGDAELAGAAAEVPEGERVTVEYVGLRYSVRVEDRAAAAAGGQPRRRRLGKTYVEKEILRGVSGVLAGEARGGRLQGRVLVNGVDAAGRIKRVSGFVFQDDVILATMTVREAVAMSAHLRLPESVSEEEKARRVARMLGRLGLERAAATAIGDSQHKGISGGERKRTAMAMEMITDPKVLFLDEPTSGLDTFTAYSVVSTLKTLAATGRTVIATVHQPSSEIFELFDDLVLMAEGRTAYSGPANQAPDYFARFGYACPDFTNPADFIFMSVLNNEEGFQAAAAAVLPGETNAQRIGRLLDAWAATAASGAAAAPSSSSSSPARTGGTDAPAALAAGRRDGAG